MPPVCPAGKREGDAGAAGGAAVGGNMFGSLLGGLRSAAAAAGSAAAGAGSLKEKLQEALSKHVRVRGWGPWVFEHPWAVGGADEVGGGEHAAL